MPNQARLLRYKPGLPVVIKCVDLVREFVTPAETVKALAGVSLTVQTGELVCVVGASGSGKTTLLNLLAGLDVPTSGEVYANSVLISELDERERAKVRLHHIGVVFQEHNLIEEFTAEQNVALPLRAVGKGAAQARAAAEELLEEVGVGSLARRLPKEMSGGQRQRVGIARALAGGRRILIADEPTGSLDSANSRQIFELLRGLCGRGVTALVASHDPIAGDFANRMLAMSDGLLRA